MKKVQAGFTLIELMIVVAIIGILAAIALPAYQDYTIRSQVSEALSLGSGLKIQVADVFADSGDIGDADSGSNGIPAANEVVGKYVDQVTVTDGVIEARMGNDAHSAVDTHTLVISPVTHLGSIEWVCKRDGTNPISDDKYVPAACR